MGKFVLFVVTVCMLAACAPKGRYSQKYDSAPSRPPTQLEQTDATVTNEPIGRGNNPYQIRGINYVPQTKRQHFEQTGIASWYGEKFHGHLTSNGEVYDMYAMTAAHKTLPLPSFVKVTNLTNNKTAIVRINDRGPFHGGRIIDLSFSAAFKLGVYDTGTAKVKIETLFYPQLVEQKELYQVALTGFESKQQAQESAQGLQFMLNKTATTEINPNNQVQLVFGPFDDKGYAQQVVEKIKQFGFENVTISPL